MFILLPTPQQPDISRPHQKQICVPSVAREILGLSTKPIPTKPFTSSATGLAKSQDDFRRDANLKVFFADSPIDKDPPKLYVKSKWHPPLDEIPQEVDTRICNFFREINRMFKRKPAISNLLPSQQKLLLWLKNHVHNLVSYKYWQEFGPLCHRYMHIHTRHSDSSPRHLNVCDYNWGRSNRDMWWPVQENYYLGSWRARESKLFLMMR